MFQDISESWLKRKQSQPDNPKAFLSRMIVNRSLDRLRVLKRERESYTGPWLPDPVSEPIWEGEYPTLSQALLRMLEQLNPYERAVYLLREIFEWEYESIADLIEKKEPACRQLLRRARQKLDGKAVRYSIKEAQTMQFLSAFYAASRESNFEPLKHLLKTDVVLYSDGGGKVSAAMKPVFGADPVLRFLVGVQRLLPEKASFTMMNLNGSPAILTWDGERLDSVLSIHFDEGGIFEVSALRNPDKLIDFQQRIASKRHS